MYTEVTIDDLESDIPNFNWLDYINWSLNGLHHVNKSETVVLAEGAYTILDIDALIERVDKRTIANYIAWRVVLFSAEFSNGALHQRFQAFGNRISGVLKSNSRAAECAEKTRKKCVSESIFV